MTDAYTPNTNNGEVLFRAELDRIATASAALEARTSALESRPAYGGMRMDLLGVHSIALSPTPVKVPAWDTLAPAAGITLSLASGDMTVQNAGVYLFDCLIGLSDIDANTTYSIDARLNNQPAGSIPGNAPEKKTDNLLLGINSMPITLAAGDIISLYLSADSAGSVDIDRAMMRLTRVG